MNLLNIIFAKPTKLSATELKWAIMLGVIMISLIFVLGLMKAVMTTPVIMDWMFYTAYMVGWLRVIPCENHRMILKAAKTNGTE